MVVLHQRWRLQSRLLGVLRSGDSSTLENLLDSGLDADTTFLLGGVKRPALNLAVERGFTKLVEILCSRHCSTSSEDREGLTALHLSALYGYADVAEVLLNHRAEINVGSSSSGDTPLHLAAANHQGRMVEFLLRHGADVDRTNKDGKTPLMYAAAKGDLESVKLLLSAGADVHVQDRTGNTALLLHVSSAWLNAEVTRLLCPDQEAVNMPNLAGAFPVLEVVKNTCVDRQEALQVLIRQEAHLDVFNCLGSTPLHLACSNSDWSSARILVRGGARADLEDSLGRTAFFIVLQNDNLLLAESILAAGGSSCQLPPAQTKTLSAVAKLFVTKAKVKSLKYTARKVLRRVWGRSTNSELENVFIPTNLKHYVYYLLE